MRPPRFRDRTAGWLGIAFLVTLLGSEAALSLPDEHATGSAVAAFYTEHRTVIVVLQLVGVLAAALLALFAWRLRAIDRVVPVAGLVVALAALAPGLITVALALAADPDRPDRAGTLNELEPRGDDVLFAGITLFAVAVVVRLGRRPRWLGLLAGLVALCCLLRFALEAAGRSRGALDSLAPLSFLLLIAALVVLGLVGYPRPSRAYVDGS